MSRPEPLQVLAVCGVGTGTSLMLRMTAEDVFKQLQQPAPVHAPDLSTARSMHADVVIGQHMHTEEFDGRAPVVVAVTNFMDKDGLRRQLEEKFEAQGWM